MASFDLALRYVAANEGGWSNHAADRGGATQYGITLKLAKRYGIEDAEQLRAMTLAEAASIYKKEFWRFDHLKSQRVATKVFDMCVNMGGGQATKLLQRALGIRADGIFGPKTLDFTNAANESLLLALLVDECKDFYNEIVAHDESQKVFLKGWLNRAERLP